MSAAGDALPDAATTERSGGPSGQCGVTLGGCSPIPLASYLKALGVLRLVAEQVDPEARGFWCDDNFVLVSVLDEEELCRFFLATYRPTPVISPWNGRAGFLEGEEGEDSKRRGAVIVPKISACRGRRFEDYKKVLSQIRAVPVVAQMSRVRAEVKKLESLRKKRQSDDAERLRLAKAEEKKLKSQLFIGLRAELDETFLDWLDACVVLVGDDSFPAPLLGSGGNEGSMDFSVNHLISLSELIDPDTDLPTAAAESAIRDALLGEASIVNLLGNPGFLGPAGSGGPNMASGFAGDVHENAWNTVLMLEGAVLFASTATRRLDSSIPSRLSSPFVVEAVRAGHGGVSQREKNVRPELWVPLWTSPVSLPELRALLAEGRATLNGRPARNGLDMARSLAALGVHRGVSAFQRYGFFERRGKGYYVAAPLDRLAVRSNPAAQLLTDLEHGRWLDRFRGLARDKSATQRARSLVRRLEDAIFDVSLERQHPAPKIQRLLSILGEAELYLARSPKARESCPPVPWLSKDWLLEDGSDEFAIAAALAGLHGRSSRTDGRRGDFIMPMRAHLAPERHGWQPDWDEQADDSVTWSLGSLEANLVATLQRRMLKAVTAEPALDDKPLVPSRMAPLAAVAAWVAGIVDQGRLASLLPGMMLVRIPAGADTRVERTIPLPGAYRLLKPFFCTNAQLARLGMLPAEGALSIPAELVRRLAVGDTAGAIALGVRRLRAAGVAVSFRDLTPGGTPGRRLLAALMVPIADYDLERLRPQGAGR